MKGNMGAKTSKMNRQDWDVGTGFRHPLSTKGTRYDGFRNGKLLDAPHRNIDRTRDICVGKIFDQVGLELW